MANPSGDANLWGYRGPIYRNGKHPYGYSLVWLLRQQCGPSVASMEGRSMTNFLLLMLFSIIIGVWRSFSEDKHDK